jgi:membrane protein DedA with SNARE-associated domain/membrane-associated phospholipid phosphatase
MESLSLSHLHTLIAYLHAHPHIGGLITFGIAFIESLALIGGLIPGSVTMTAIGALIGSGAMPMVPTMLWAIFGAFAGDFLSYGLGAYYNVRLKNMWPFRKHPQWLQMGQDFFSKHGGKSVLIGRFFGPVRSLVPLIAGLMHMTMLRFILSALVAAILWSVLYILPGIIVGALSLELPPAAATKFILTVLGIVAFGWIILLLLHLFFKTIVRLADRAMDCIWQWLEQHRATRWLTTFLSDSSKANQHRQLTLAAFGLFCVGLFLYLFYCMVTHTHLAHLNEPTFELLRSLRTRVGDDLMLAATLLGNKYVQLTAGILIFAWLFLKRYRWAAWHWFSVIVLSAGTSQALKLLYYSPRPTGLLNPQLTSSFPSGHTILATALFSFLAMLLTHHLPAERRKTPFLVASFFIIVVALSRIYLGTHWLVDVLASLFLGLGCAVLVNLSYLRRESKPLPVVSVASVSVSIFLVLWLSYGVMAFHKQQEDNTLYWPTVTLDTATWWKVPHPETPLFILSRLGKPEAALNVQWLDSLDHIRKTLITGGWQEHSVSLNWKGSLNRLSPTANPQHLPVWPALYQNASPVLMMTKQEPGHPPLYFVLWKSNITLSDSNQTLWVGSVHYLIPRPKKNVLNLTPEQNYQLYNDAMLIFRSSLHEVIWQEWTIPENDQPPVMHALNWNGKLLLIKPISRPRDDG